MSIDRLLDMTGKEASGRSHTSKTQEEQVAKSRRYDTSTLPYSALIKGKL